MDDTRYHEICSYLPVFPLPRTVLLPGSTLNLHVFEDRYRALVSDCLEGDLTMGIATLGSDPSLAADRDPVLYPEVGVGQIVAYQGYPDGRSNIVLRAIGGATIVREIDSPTPYRVVEGVPLDEDLSGSELALRSLKMLVLQLGGLAPKASREAERLVQLDGKQLVDDLARRLLDSPDDQRCYLRSPRLVDRVAMVSDRLAKFMVRIGPAGEA